MRGVSVALSVLAAAAPLSAQSIALETLSDVQVWETDAGSRLLARNSGRVAIEGSVFAWAAVRVARSLDLTAIAYVAAGTLEPEDAEFEIDQVAVRFAPARAFALDVGKLLMPVGAFGRRRFADLNPLIGAPDLYPTQYPWGAVVSGAAGQFDYRVGLVSLPAVNSEYSPQPSHRLRPVAGIGLTLGPAFRIGATAIHGPYLGDTVAAQLPAGTRWQQFNQTIAAVDARLSVGYTETHVELAWSSYDAPTAGAPVHGLGYFVETRATVSPRWFVAGRYEWYRYPFILPVNANFWVATATTQLNGEVGAGFLISPRAQVKVSWRRDHWPGAPPAGSPPAPDGYALAVQASLRTDIVALLTPRY